MLARIAWIAVLSGCSSQADLGNNVPPVVEALEMPTSVGGGGRTVFTVRGKISYRDEDGAVTRIKLAFAAGPNRSNAVQELDARVNGSYAQRATVALNVQVEGGSPTAQLDYEVWVVDDRGAESAHEKRAVTLTTEAAP